MLAQPRLVVVIAVEVRDVQEIGLLDAFAGVDAAPLAALWSQWKHAAEALAAAGTQQAQLDRERERLAWQIGEVTKLEPAAGEWAELEAEHAKHANAQS